MKTVLFDLFEAQPAFETKFHGGGEYIKKVYFRLITSYSHLCKIIVFFDKDKFLDDWILESFSAHNVIVEYVKKREDVKDLFAKYDIDVFYTGLPYHYRGGLFPAKIRKIGTVHGLREIEMPVDKYTYLYFKGTASVKQKIKFLLRDRMSLKEKNLFYEGFRYLDDVVCVSNHTAYALKNYYPTYHGNVRVLYTPSKYVETGNELEKLNYGKFILLISCDRWLKNSYRALKAIDNLYKNNQLSDYKVVAVGGVPKKIKEKLSYPERLITLDYVAPHILETLYRECDFFVYPSLNEGFGMPPLEAMKYDKTCVVSGVCSIPEICGDAVYYINPYDVQEMQTRFLFASENKIPKTRIRERIRMVNEKQDADLNALCEYIIGLSK